jgi:hypothetical protein
MQKYILFEHEMPEKPYRMKKYIPFSEIFGIGANGMQKCIRLKSISDYAPL